MNVLFSKIIYNIVPSWVKEDHDYEDKGKSSVIGAKKVQLQLMMKQLAS